MMATAASTRESRIGLDAALRSEGDEPPSGKRRQTRRHGRIGGAMPGRSDFRDNLATIGDQHAFAGPHVSEVFAQAILQFTNAHGLHLFNVASCSHIVNGASAHQRVENAASAGRLFDT